MAPKIAAILAAGGMGARFAASLNAQEGASALVSHKKQSAAVRVPKQFLQLKGCPIFVWSLEILLASPSVACAIVVSPPDMVTEVQAHIKPLGSRFSEKKLKVVPGGETRQQSVYMGLVALEEEGPDYVLVHDAARPFLTSELLERFLACMVATGACTTALPASDTIKRVDHGKLAETLDRESLILVQTPQGGRFDWLLQAHKKAANEEQATTDDAAVLSLAGHDVSIVNGASYNVKITRAEDMVLADALAAILFADRL